MKGHLGRMWQVMSTSAVASTSKITLERIARARSTGRSLSNRSGASNTSSGGIGERDPDRLLINWALRNGIAPATRERRSVRPNAREADVLRNVDVEHELSDRTIRRHRGRSHAGRFVCNEDPERLIEWYTRMGVGDLLGQRNAWGVDDEGQSLGWRAVTHKSWGHGLIENQERVRYIGRRLLHAKVITNLHTAFLKASSSPESSIETGVQSSISTTSTLLRLLTSTSLSDLLDPTRSLADLAKRTELDRLIRWNPSYLEDMRLSGVKRVQGESIEAVLGAIWHVGGQRRAEDWTMKWIWPVLKIPQAVREISED